MVFCPLPPREMGMEMGFNELKKASDSRKI